MAKQVDVFTLEELKEKNPEAFEKLLEEWAQRVDYVPWAEEIVDSYKVIVQACGGDLRDWSIGPDRGDAKVVGIDDEAIDRGGDARTSIRYRKNWFCQNVLKPNGYTKANGHPQFPGLCKFTGVCFDDDLLEKLWRMLDEGNTVTEALENLAMEASRLMEWELENQQGEEGMLANWEGRLYTLEGVEV